MATCRRPGRSAKSFAKIGKRCGRIYAGAILIITRLVLQAGRVPARIVRMERVANCVKIAASSGQMRRICEATVKIYGRIGAISDKISGMGLRPERFDRMSESFAATGGNFAAIAGISGRIVEIFVKTAVTSVRMEDGLIPLGQQVVQGWGGQ